MVEAGVAYQRESMPNRDLSWKCYRLRYRFGELKLDFDFAGRTCAIAKRRAKVPGRENVHPDRSFV
jgi:hypothetical protein